MKRRVVVWTTFNQWLPNAEKYNLMGLMHPAIRTDWIEKRYKIWRKTAAVSIFRQSLKDWEYAVLCHHKSIKQCRKLFSSIDSRIAPLFTAEDNVGWIKRVSQGYDEVVSVRLDSDDMYHPGALEQAMKWAETSKKEYAYWLRGYGFDMKTKRLWRYETRSSGPFFVHRWKVNKLLLNGRIKDPLRHGRIKWVGSDKLPYRNFCVNVNHGLNDSSRPNKKRFVSVVEGQHRDDVIKIYGLPL